MNAPTENDITPDRQRMDKITADDALRYRAVAAYFQFMADGAADTVRDGDAFDLLLASGHDQGELIACIDERWAKRGTPQKVHANPIYASVDRSNDLPIIDLLDQVMHVGEPGGSISGFTRFACYRHDPTTDELIRLKIEDDEGEADETVKLDLKDTFQPMTFAEYLKYCEKICKRSERGAIKSFRRATKGATTVEEAKKVIVPGDQRLYDKMLAFAAEDYRLRIQEDGLIDLRDKAAEQGIEINLIPV